MIDYANYLRGVYPYLSINEIKIMEEQAKEILVHLLYKSAKTITEEKRQYAYREYEFWILRCIEEIIQKKGISNAISYSENGISITFSQAQISKELTDEIVPFAGV